MKRRGFLSAAAAGVCGLLGIKASKGKAEAEVGGGRVQHVPDREELVILARAYHWLCNDEHPYSGGFTTLVRTDPAISVHFGWPTDLKIPPGWESADMNKPSANYTRAMAYIAAQRQSECSDDILRRVKSLM